MSMRVLVTGAGSFLGHGIIKSLRMSALEPYIIGADPSATATGLYRCDRAYLIPLARDPAYMARIRAVLVAEKVDAILMGTDVELGLFAAEREALEREFGCVVVVSSPEVIEIADDKWKTYVFLKERGFPHPATSLADGARELARSVGFPLIVKPRVGARSVGVRRVLNDAQLTDALRHTADAVVQEYVVPEDQEYTVGTLTFDGRCDNVITMRRDLRDGNTFRAYVRDEPAVREKAREVAEALGAHGPANFQLRSTSGGAKIFEINARFSGTTPIRAAMGFNEVEAVLRHLVLREPMTRLSFRDGVVLRYWNEVVVDQSEFDALNEKGMLDKPMSRITQDF